MLTKREPHITAQRIDIQGSDKHIAAAVTAHLFTVLAPVAAHTHTAHHSTTHTQHSTYNTFPAPVAAHTHTAHHSTHSTVVAPVAAHRAAKEGCMRALVS